MERKKIVLDADVLIHFAKAGYLNVLPSILPEYEYIVLSVVYDEVRSIQQQIDRQMEFLKNIRKVQFEPTGEMRREYAMLTSRFGRGESLYFFLTFGPKRRKLSKALCPIRVLYAL